MTLIEAAAFYIGKREKPSNSGFYDEKVEAAMREIGWVPPQAYCILACKRWAIDAFPERKDKYMKLMTPNVQDTFDNFKKNGNKITMVPEPNTIVFWSHWKNGILMTTGHAGVCKGASGSGFETIEGNTDAESGRDGDGFYERTRHIIRIVPPTGSVLITEGFVHL